MQLVEIDESNRALALTVEVRPEQVPYVADEAAVARTILRKCAGPTGDETWTPYVAIDADGAAAVFALVASGDEVRLRHMAVDHRRQRTGVGRRVVGEVIALILRDPAGWRSIVVTTHPDNRVALALYESVGFARTGAFEGIEPVLTLDLR